MGIKFTGASNMSANVASPSAYTSQATLSLCSWIYITANNGVEASILFIACGDSVAKSRAKLSMNYSAPNLVYRAGARTLDADALQNFTSTTVVTLNTWHHFATTIDYTNKVIRLYVDGALDSTSGALTFGSATTDTSASLGTILGNGFAGGGSGITGTMADARIYTKLLSANEILSIYNGRGRDSIRDSLFSRWRMNEGADTTTVTGASVIKDIVSAKNATPTNSPVYASTPFRFTRRA